MLEGFSVVITTLASAKVDYVVIGGVAGVLHGAARITYDIDLVYARNEENLIRLADCLAPFDPYPRGAPAGLPFLWDATTLRNGMNFTLTTSIGPVDLLGYVERETYESLVINSLSANLDGLEFRYVSLDDLIKLKRMAGRPKDYEALSELELLREQQRGSSTP